MEIQVCLQQCGVFSIPKLRRNQLEGNKWENQISNKKIDNVDETLLRQYTNHAHEVGRLAISYTDKKLF